jgi:dihydrofolate reductase
MRKIKLFIACSLDGFIAGPNGEIDWLFTDGDYGYSDFYKSIDSTLNGYKTYEKTLEFGEFPYKGKKNYVFTRQPGRQGGARVQFITTDPAAFTRQLKAQPGKDVFLVGGGEIIRLLYAERLIDEYCIAFHPVILGAGIPLFSNLAGRQPLRLTDCKSYPSGLVQVTYVPL